MHLRWQLVISHGLAGLAALAVGHLFLGEEHSYPLMIATGGLVALLVGLGCARLVTGLLQRLSDRIRQLASTEPGGEVWKETLEVDPFPDLEIALEDLREQTRQRVARLAMEKSRLEGILESITEGILVTGRDGRVVMANRALAQLFGIRGTLQGRLPVEVVRNNEVEEAISHSLEAEEGSSLEMTLRLGKECHLDVHTSPIIKSGDRIGVVTVFYNITKIRQLERVRRDFVANVSHELRTPLTAIKGYAETLAEGALDDRKASERFIQVILAHADRLNRLLDDILDLSRLEAENLDSKFEVCSLRSLVEGCISPVAQAAARKEIEIALDVEEDLRVVCDPKLIEQAVINLLDNAVKYTPEEGSVVLRTLVTGDEEELEEQKKVILEVQDTGIGIPEKDLERIFERFYRVDKGRSRAMGGTGLGLSIVRHIVQVHGERVWVESELGKGTTFAFTLPLA